ncbi:MAG TPA: serine hydrolase domain-containing protein [Gemmatimonadales bacterium]
MNVALLFLMMRLALPLVALAWLARPARLAGQRWEEVDRAVAGAIEHRIFPGAVVVVGRRDTVLFARGYGRLTWRKSARRPRPDSTLWDLASLTKIIATTSLAMVYVDQGLLGLDDPVVGYAPEFTGEGREAITVRMLLDHTSGLRAWAPLWRESRTRDEALALVLREAPTRPPGMAAEYSDLNAILLGLVMERVGGARLDTLAVREIFRPLDLRDLRFGVRRADRRRTAPSRLERGGRVVTGVVQDDNARRLGGVAGHAGLFGSGLAVARFAQAWLSFGAAGEHPWVRPETVRRFFQRSPGAGSRALGWNTRDTATATMFGTLAPPEAVGHSGWTGTSLWLDPTNDLFVVLLSNRSISPRGRRTLEAIRVVRGEVSDAARRAALGECGAAAAPSC